MILRRVCLSKLGSTLPSVTLDKLNSAATISWMLIYYNMQLTPDSALPISTMLLDLPFTFAINL